MQPNNNHTSDNHGKAIVRETAAGLFTGQMPFLSPNQQRQSKKNTFQTKAVDTCYEITVDTTAVQMKQTAI